MLINSPAMMARNDTVDITGMSALKLFFKLDETIPASGTVNIVESVSGGHLTATVNTNLEQGGPTNSIRFLGGAITPTDFSLESYTTQDLLFVMAYTPELGVTANLNIGAYGNDTVSMRDSGIPNIRIQGGNDIATEDTMDYSMSSPTYTDDVPVSIVVTVDRDGNTTGETNIITTSANTAQAAVDTVTVGGLASDVIVNPSITNSVTLIGVFYGIALFAFDNGIPGDAFKAGHWMANRWYAGEKVIWPNAIAWS